MSAPQDPPRRRREKRRRFKKEQDTLRRKLDQLEAKASDNPTATKPGS